MGAGDLWNNPKQAQRTIDALKIVRAQLEPLEAVMSKFDDAQVAYQLAKEAGDNELLVEADEQLFQLLNRMQRVELQSLLSEKHDHRNAFVTIQAGAGGTEAQDWAEILERMYLKYWQVMGFKPEEMARNYGPEAGITDCTYAVRGPFAYGYLSCEHGTHRLARVSPYNAEGKRQTSFATVDVTPEFEDSTLEILDKDVQVTAFVRAVGPGGQNVNKVASAIRLVHIPTGIMVVASTFRDQPQNRKQAFAVLRSKLEQVAEEKRLAEIEAAKGGKVERGWGTQIRSYVFYDNRVKDHRSGYEEPNPLNVLDGRIEAFVDAELKRRRLDRERSRSKA